jgi:hypothetical protein
MAAMGREQDPVAFAEIAIFALTLDEQARRAIHHKHELVTVLIVPLTPGRRLTRGHDALDAQAQALDKQIDDLIWQGPSR